MKKVLFLIAFISMGANAQSSKLDLAVELVTVMDFDSQMNVMIENINAMQARQIQQFDIPESAQPFLKQHLEDSMSLLLSTFKSDEVKRQYAGLYANVFSEEELTGILKFYKTGHGKAFLKKFPAVMAGITKISESQVQSVMPKLMAMNQDFKEKIAEIKAKSK